MILHRLARLGLVAIAAASFPGSAAASQLISRGATGVRLAVSPDGSALLSYRAGGKARQVRASGAQNALAPTRSLPQVAFSLDYSAEPLRGRGRTHRTAPSCRPYDGPPLHWLVAACNAPDGSYWAVQSWRRALPDYGLQPSLEEGAPDLRLAHWRGAPALFSVNVDWSYAGRFQHLYGSLSYLGNPVFGFRSTRFGVPLDSFGRSVYVDTYDSAYGSGWRRENSFLTHQPTGYFCYGFYPHGKRPAGTGNRYRATIIGPGVTPDLFWQGTAPGAYEPAADAEQLRLGGADRRCRSS